MNRIKSLALIILVQSLLFTIAANSPVHGANSSPSPTPTPSATPSPSPSPIACSGGTGVELNTVVRLDQKVPDLDLKKCDFQVVFHSASDPSFRMYLTHPTEFETVSHHPRYSQDSLNFVLTECQVFTLIEKGAFIDNPQLDRDLVQNFLYVLSHNFIAAKINVGQLSSTDTNFDWKSLTFEFDEDPTQDGTFMYMYELNNMLFTLQTTCSR